MKNYVAIKYHIGKENLITWKDFHNIASEKREATQPYIQEDVTSVFKKKKCACI